ncbi:hypothetical protein [Flavobacterium sp. HNIBRBA15423]|uniref:hypothetical protein n=1 Tax=Flavobacterium sp. HNIBRBA15423 TaxID=3458683 RepID=UPI004043AEF2
MQKLTLSKGEKKQYEITNENISALNFFITSAGAVMTNLTDFKVSISLRNNKKEMEKIFVGDLLDLYNINTATNPAYEPIANPGNGTFSFPLFFGTVMNLQNGLTIYLEIQNNFSQVEACLLEIGTYQDMGIMTHIPIFNKYYLDATLAVHNYALGSFVKFVNIWGGGTNAVNIEQLLIESDKFKGEYDSQSIYLQGFTRGEGQYPVTYIDPYTLFKFPQLLNDLNLKLTLDTAQASRVMYVTRYVMTDKIVQNFVKQTEKHNQMNTAIVKETTDISCACR